MKPIRRLLRRLWGGTADTGLYLAGDIVYSKYRQGVIRRHIAKNGRYFSNIWLRSQDAVDLGALEWPGAELVPSVNDNLRQSQDWAQTAENHWVPVIYYERLGRSVPAGYAETGTLGYMALSPGLNCIPLYEWVHNTTLEQPGYDFVDHYYSTDPQSPVACHRYKLTGIVGYLQIGLMPEFSAGFKVLYVGYHPTERNHLLTTDKTNPLGLVNFQSLGLIRSDESESFNAKLVEYRREATPVHLTDNCYLAFAKAMLAEQVPPIEPEVEHIATGPGDQLSSKEVPPWSPDDQMPPHKGAQPWSLVWTAPLTTHSLLYTAPLARQVVAGGCDNPLYEGGLALATFSLEHIHEVSPHSLQYARLLYDFIEASEERAFKVLEEGTGGSTGYLRRRRHAWGEATTWGASTDELVGVLLGLKYFIRATAGSDATYHERAVALLRRIAIYLSSRDWIYMDTRIYHSVENYVQLMEGEKYEQHILGRATGTLAFQYPFSRIFKEILGSSYSGPETFDKTVDLAKELGAGIAAAETDVSDDLVSGFLGFMLFIYPAAACLAEAITYFTDYDDFVLGCGRNIDTHSEVYELLIQNAYPIAKHLGFPNKGAENHTMLLYTAWMVLDSDVVGADRKKTFAKRLSRYIYDMWGRGSWYVGHARENLLFAVIARRCFQLLTHDEIRGELDLEGPTWFQKNRVDDFEEEVDRVIGKCFREADHTWQSDLPLGEPGRKGVPANSPPYPWLVNPFPPSGIGRNSAWRHQDMHFTYINRSFNTTPGESFREKGPWYTDDNSQFSAEKTAGHLRRLARVGYTPDDPEYDQLMVSGNGLYFMLEAGGNDLMFMRMLMTELGMAPPRFPDKDVEYKVLPIDGPTPW